jgi:hypothetical protein
MRSSHRTGAVGEGRRGSIVRLICDSSELYLSATTDADWIAREGGSIRGRAATGSPLQDSRPSAIAMQWQGSASSGPSRTAWRTRDIPPLAALPTNVQRAPRAVRIDPERSFAGCIVGRSLQPEREEGDALRTDPRRATPFLPLCTTLPLFTTACAGRGPQNSDQQERHGGPLKPDVVEAAKHVDQKQEDYEGDHHSG